ncbi:MAG: protein kinase [Myxococcota bacterium]
MNGGGPIGGAKLARDARTPSAPAPTLDSGTRAAEVFARARDVADDAALDALLARECADDAPLRAEVLALLGRDGAPGSTPSDVVAARGELPAGTMLGDKYRVASHLGTGGVGIVYRADQLHPVARQVAIKVLSGGIAGAALARFEAERDALSRLGHPHIAAIYDAGQTQADKLYVVMELVDGLPIDEYCDRHALGLEARINLFLRVCRGVHHAHQRGIIHRDLKPTNILVAEVEGEAIPKIIDFGIAVVSGDTPTRGASPATATQFVGTPDYASPEQAGAGDVTTTSDVYSLGIVLFQLLTGDVPHRLQGSLLAWKDAMATRAVPRPSAFLADAPPEPGPTTPPIPARALKGDLDAIIQKATARERAAPLRRRLRAGRRPRALAPAPPGAGAAEHPALRHGALHRPQPRPEHRRHRRAHRPPGEHRGVRPDGGPERARAPPRRGRRARGPGRARAGHRAPGPGRPHGGAQPLASAAAALAARDADGVQKHLDAIPERFRGWEWQWLGAETDRSQASFRAHAHGITALVPSADGTRLASGASDGELALWDVRAAPRLVARVQATPAPSAGWRSRRTARWSSPPTPRRASWRGTRPRCARCGTSTAPTGSTRPARASTATSWWWPAAMTRRWSSWRPRPASRRASSASARAPSSTPRSPTTAASSTRPRAAWWCSTPPAATRGPSPGASPPSTPSAAASSCGPGASGTAAASSTSTAARRSATSIAPAASTTSRWAATCRWRCPTSSTPSASRPTSPTPPPGSPATTARSTRWRWRPTVARCGPATPPASSSAGRAAWRPRPSPSARPTTRRSAARWPPTARPSRRSAGAPSSCGTRGACTERWTRWLSRKYLTAVGFSPDGRELAAADWSGHLWHLAPADGAPSEPLELGPGAPVTRLAYVGPGAAVAVTRSGELMAFATADGHIAWRRVAHHDTPIAQLALSPDRRLVATAGASANALPTFGEGVPDAASPDPTVKLWRSDSGAPAVDLEPALATWTALAFSADGSVLAAGADDGTLAQWRVADGRLLAPPTRLGDRITGLTFSRDARRLLVGRFGSVVIVDAARLTPLLTLDGPPANYQTMALDDAGRLTILGSVYPLVVFDPRPDDVALHGRTTELRALVDARFERAAGVDAVVSDLAADASLDPALRADAIALARARGDNPNGLNSWAWAAVRYPGEAKATVALARQRAELCADRWPRWEFENTRALARYRDGDAAGALSAAEKSLALAHQNGIAASPSDWAIQALAHAALGARDAAQADLDRASRDAETDAWRDDAEVRAMVEEVRGVLEPAY